MAKQPETRDRFRIIFDVDLQTMGPVIAMLNRMGITVIDHELITDVIRFNKKNTSGARGKFETTGRDALLALFKPGKAIAATTIKAAFKVEGRNPASVSPIIDALLKKKQVKRVNPGTYQLTPAGEKAFKAQAEVAKKAKAEPPKGATNGAAHMNGGAAHG